MPAPTTEWVDSLKSLIPIVVPAITWMLGRATKGVTNQGKLDQLVTDVAKLKECQDKHTTALAEHSLLHQGYVAMQTDVRTVQREVQKIGYSVSAICGKLGVRGIGE